VSGVPGKVCAITGAGSGIGRALALGLARRGARVALADVDEAGLAETAKAIGADAHTRRVDVTDRDAVTTWADEVAAHFGAVHQIYNNAGIGYSRTVLESDWDDYDRVLGVNLWGVIHGTKAFLPHVIASGDGHVVNISSLNGSMAQGEMSHYCTAKFGVRGFTESLRMEMLAGGHRVGVTCVQPGGIKTPIATHALEQARALGKPVTEAEEARERTYNEKLLRMPADKAASIIIKGVEAGRPRVLVGNDARALELMTRLLPTGYQRIVARAQRRIMPH
jgi:NAD(P)-dependent dehydrogenase (short-subunit alcohol dehydrogenase family)